MALRREDRRALLGVLAVGLAATAALSWWQQRQDDALAARLAAQARPGDIRLISSTTCIFCTRARQWLQAGGVPFAECFIERDADCAERYRALGAPGTPLVLVRGQAQLGFSPPRVLEGLGGR
jgi:glutaredoxin